MLEMSDFTGPNVYFTFTPGEPVRIEKMGRTFEVPTLVVPVGSIVYRADAGGAKAPADVVPAFFSNDTSITVYKRGNEANVSKYRVTRDMRLFVMTVQSLKTIFAFHPELTAEDKEYMKLYLSKQAEGAVMPIYPTPDRYLNRTIANIICRLGVDGWIVQPYDAEKKTGMKNYSMAREKVLKTEPILPYKPEIMVCRWTDCMERIVEGGRKKLTRRNRTRRQLRRGI
jgi:hypothetical protein